MSKHFYKDTRILMKLCKADGCKAWYRPEKGTWHAKLGYCYVHRKVYYRNWYINEFLPWFKKQPKEKQEAFRKMRKDAWDKWVKNNLDKRRQQALRSYHANKEKNRKKRNKRRREAYARSKGLV